MIDVYGYIEFKGKDFDWEYYKGWGRRANLSMPPTDVFNISDWIVSGTGALNNPNSNANSTWPYGMSQYFIMKYSQVSISQYIACTNK